MNQTELIKIVHDQIIDYLEDQDKNIGLTKHPVSPEYINKEFNISLDHTTDFDGIKEIIEKYLSVAVKTGSTNFYNQLFSVSHYQLVIHQRQNERRRCLILIMQYQMSL